MRDRPSHSSKTGAVPQFIRAITATSPSNYPRVFRNSLPAPQWEQGSCFLCAHDDNRPQAAYGAKSRRGYATRRISLYISHICDPRRFGARPLCASVFGAPSRASLPRGQRLPAFPVCRPIPNPPGALCRRSGGHSEAILRETVKLSPLSARRSSSALLSKKSLRALLPRPPAPVFMSERRLPRGRLAALWPLAFATPC